MDGPTGARPQGAFVDRPAARLLALLCFGLSVGLLAFLHRDDLLPTTAEADDAFARCYAERADDVDQMLAEGVIDGSQATLFKSRAEAFCRAQTDATGGAPSGLPPPLAQ